MDPYATHQLGLATAGPTIIQLSPIPGNIYDVDQFYYDPAAKISHSNFGAILTFASAHGCPVVVHNCLDIHEFQVAHPSVIVRPINEVPPAVIAWGCAFLAVQAGGLAVVQPPSAVTGGPAIAQSPPDVAVMAFLGGDPPFILPTAPSTSVGNDTPSIGSNPLLLYESLSCGGDPPFGRGRLFCCWLSFGWRCCLGFCWCSGCPSCRQASTCGRRLHFPN